MKEEGKSVCRFHLYTDTEIKTMHVTPEGIRSITIRMAEWIDAKMEKGFEEEERKKKGASERK